MAQISEIQFYGVLVRIANSIDTIAKELSKTREISKREVDQNIRESKQRMINDRKMMLNENRHDDLVKINIV